MTLTLTQDTETRLRTVAAGRGQAPELLHETLLKQALAEAEQELQETLSGLDRSVQDFAAGRWITPEQLDQRLQARANKIRMAQSDAVAIITN